MQKAIQNISILGAGWLGLSLGAALVDKGYLVKGSTTRSSRLFEIAEHGLQAYRLKVDERMQGDLVDDFFQTDVLIVNIPPGRRDPKVATRYPAQVSTILRYAQRAKVPYCIFVSSSSVYGNVNRKVTEVDVLQPETASGRALVEAEAMMRSFRRPRTTILRMGGLVGGNRKAGRFLAGKKDIPNGMAPVNLVHRDDCIGVIEAIIEQEKWATVFNVCADEHPVKEEIYTQQALELGLEPPQFREGGKVTYKIVDNEKVKNELNYTFKWPDPMLFP